MQRESYYVYLVCRQWEDGKLSGLQIFATREKAEFDAKEQNKMWGEERFVVIEQEVF